MGIAIAGAMRKMRRIHGPNGFSKSNITGPWSMRQISHAMTYLRSAPQRQCKKACTGVVNRVRRKEKKRAFSQPSDG